MPKVIKSLEELKNCDTKKVLLGLLMGIFASFCWLPSALAKTSFPGKGGDNSVGIILIEPFGITGKHNLANAQAIDWAVGAVNEKLYIHGDFLMEPTEFVHFGAGLRVKGKRENSDQYIGLRAPIGVHRMFPEYQVEVFGEAAVVFDITPKTETNLVAAVGARYFFF
ncbi:MAG: hypothetical protein V4736_06475 [Bdellovibrionota bacterium]